MKRVKMTSISVRVRGGLLVVEGGWHATVPTVEPDKASLAVLSSYLGGEKEARRTIQATFESAWISGLRRCVKRRVVEYLALYPQKAKISRRYGKAYLTAEGFDAEAVQTMYMPFEITGRRGKEWVRDELARMAAHADQPRGADTRRGGTE